MFGVRRVRARSASACGRGLPPTSTVRWGWGGKPGGSDCSSLASLEGTTAMQSGRWARNSSAQAKSSLAKRIVPPTAQTSSGPRKPPSVSTPSCTKLRSPARGVSRAPVCSLRSSMARVHTTIFGTPVVPEDCAILTGSSGPKR